MTIIGISGITGAGKTTLAQALAKNYHATLVNWDEFDDISSGPDDYVDWYNRKGSYNEWDYPGLADVLHTLKAQKTSIHPVNKTQLRPTEYVVYDAPLGRLHTQTGRYIDICIHIDVPLDVSLGRRILRDFKDHDKTKMELLEEIEFYLTHSRPLFFDDDLKLHADFIVNGMLKTEDQVQAINQYLIDLGKHEKL